MIVSSSSSGCRAVRQGFGLRPPPPPLDPPDEGGGLLGLGADEEDGGGADLTEVPPLRGDWEAPEDRVAPVEEEAPPDCGAEELTEGEEPELRFPELPDTDPRSRYSRWLSRDVFAAF